MVGPSGHGMTDLTPRQKEIYDAYHALAASAYATAKKFKVDKNVIRCQLFECAKKGYPVTSDDYCPQAPAGFALDKTTIQTNREGDIIQRWDRASPHKLTDFDFAKEFTEAIKKHTPPQYPKLKYSSTSGNAAEISIHDLHFGSLCWGPETGQNYDIKIAQKIYLDAVLNLAAEIERFEPERILFPVGSDFFNVNSKLNMTVAGTPQDEDCRYQKTYVYGRRMVVMAVDLLMVIAPVDVVIVPGNHDEERAFYLGDSLSSWYRDTEAVVVDNSPTPRKYWKFGKCLVGLTHGDKEVKGTLPLIMATEEPKLWAETEYREWHTGHLHHKNTKSYDYATESNGIRERILPSLAATDSWHKKKGYGGLREAESFIWNRDKGNVASFRYHP